MNTRWSIVTILFVGMTLGTLILLMNRTSTFAQGNNQWSIAIGGETQASSIQATNDGGFVVAGTNTNSDIYQHSWIVKLNTDGQIAWQKVYRAYEITGSSLNAIQQTSDGGYIVTAYGFLRIGLEDYAWILKLNSDGSVAWQKTYGGSGSDRVSDVKLTGDGGYIVGGHTSSFGVDSSDYWVLKLDSNGALVWQKTYGYSSDEKLSVIQQTSDSGYIIAGNTTVRNTNGEAQVIKLNNDGSVAWQKIYSASGFTDNIPEAIQQTSDGGYVVTGLVSVSTGRGYDAWILKLNSDGSVAWQKTYGGSGTDYAYDIKLTSDAGYVVVGSFNSRAWVFKLDGSGNILWQKTYGNNGAYSLGLTNDNGYIISGNTGNFSNSWVAKLNSQGEIPGCSIIGVSNASVVNNLATTDNSHTLSTQTITAIPTTVQFSPANTTEQVTYECTVGPPPATVTPTPTPTPPTPTATPVGQVKPVVVLVHGWQGIAPTASSCNTGILKFDSNNPITMSDPIVKDWAELAQDLEDDGFQVYVAHLDSGPERTPLIGINAECLKRQLNSIRNQLPQGDGFRIIAHSMGGLVTRAYIEGGLYFNSAPVKQFFTLGTPHQGAPGSKLRKLVQLVLRKPFLDCNKQEGGCEMLTNRINAEDGFNRSYSSRNPNVDYYVVGGDLDFLDAQGYARFLTTVSPKAADDGFVPINSSTNLAGIKQSLRMPGEAHVTGWSYKSYMSGSPDGLYTDNYFYCIRPVLVDKNPNGCQVVRTATVSEQSTPPINAFPPATFGNLVIGQLHVENVTLDKQGEAVFAASISAAASFSLIAPNGTVIDPIYAQTHPSEATFTSEGLLMYQIHNAAPGVWQLKLQAGTNLDYGLFSGFESNFILSATTDKGGYLLREQVKINAQFTGPSAPTNVTLKLQLPDGTIQNYNLATQGNGAYTISLPLSKSGYYNGTVIAEGTSQYGQYRREDYIIFLVKQRIFMPIILKQQSNN